MWTSSNLWAPSLPPIIHILETNFHHSSSNCTKHQWVACIKITCERNDGTIVNNFLQKNKNKFSNEPALFSILPIIFQFLHILYIASTVVSIYINLQYNLQWFFKQFVIFYIFFLVRVGKGCMIFHCFDALQCADHSLTVCNFVTDQAAIKA